MLWPFCANKSSDLSDWRTDWRTTGLGVLCKSPAKTEKPRLAGAFRCG